MPSASRGHTGESDALVAVLQDQFPLYNQDSLTDVLQVTACLSGPHAAVVALLGEIARQSLAVTCFGQP